MTACSASPGVVAARKAVLEPILEASCTCFVHSEFPQNSAALDACCSLDDHVDLAQRGSRSLVEEASPPR